jgi:hypothetical protein
MPEHKRQEFTDLSVAYPSLTPLVAARLGRLGYATLSVYLLQKDARIEILAVSRGLRW